MLENLAFGGSCPQAAGGCILITMEIKCPDCDEVFTIASHQVQIDSKTGERSIGLKCASTGRAFFAKWNAPKIQFSEIQNLRT